MANSMSYSPKRTQGQSCLAQALRKGSHRRCLLSPAILRGDRKLPPGAHVAKRIVSLEARLLQNCFYMPCHFENLLPPAHWNQSAICSKRPYLQIHCPVIPAVQMVLRFSPEKRPEHRSGAGAPDICNTLFQIPSPCMAAVLQMCTLLFRHTYRSSPTHTHASTAPRQEQHDTGILLQTRNYLILGECLWGLRRPPAENNAPRDDSLWALISQGSDEVLHHFTKVLQKLFICAPPPVAEPPRKKICMHDTTHNGSKLEQK